MDGDYLNATHRSPVASLRLGSFCRKGGEFCRMRCAYDAAFAA
jgi:hypothetical protein